MINIRKAAKEDLQSINEVYIQGAIDEMLLQYPLKYKNKLMKDLRQAERSRMQSWKKEISSKGYLWLVAEQDRKVIGFSVAEIKNKKNGWLSLNYILREFRGKGVGRKFTQIRIEWLKENKVKEVFAHTFLKNNASMKNLRKFGFKPTGVTMRREL